MNHKKKKKNKRRSEDICEGRRASPFSHRSPCHAARGASLIFFYFPHQKINRNFLFLFRFGLIERAGGMRIVVISSVGKRKKGGTHKTVKCDKSQKGVAPIRLAP
jgi:hypothetical protein